MVIAPLVFSVVVHGIASAGDLRKVGRVGAKSIIYFEVVTTRSSSASSSPVPSAPATA